MIRAETEVSPPEPVGLADFVRMCESLPRGPRFPCGHPQSDENTRMSSGTARCLTCHRENNRMWHINNREVMHHPV